MKRTAFLLALLVSALSVVTSCAKKQETNTMNTNKKTLVAYFSATGTTERVAGFIANATGGELYAINPTDAYSGADLDWTVKTSRCCRENDDPTSRPAFNKTKNDLSDYDVIYLGFPNWWNGAPRIINTFLEAYDLKGKTVRLFMTSGGSGIENSERTLKQQYPDIDWQPGRLLNGASQATVDEWIKGIE